LAILVIRDRGLEVKAEFFDTRWEALSGFDKYQAPEDKTPKPACLDEMLKAAEKLSEPFPFVRCDFYAVGDKLYFGELTFTPAGGLHTSETEIDGKSMAEYLQI